MMVEQLKQQIDAIFSNLIAALGQPDARARRDAAHAAFEAVEALRQRQLSTADDADNPLAARLLLDEARQKAWSLYEAYHQELQQQLEWASSRDFENE